MNGFNIALWAFPILFIIHELEEIFFIKHWYQKNWHTLHDTLPQFILNKLPLPSHITTRTFTIGALEEFIIILLTSLCSLKAHWYYLWIGLFIAFTLHLIIHIVQAIVIKKYIPALATSCLCLPICCFLLFKIISTFNGLSVLIFTIVGFVFMVINLLFIHNVLIKLIPSKKQHG